jgi:hypothetical protein
MAKKKTVRLEKQPKRVKRQKAKRRARRPGA